jgi:toxin CptA
MHKPSEATLLFVIKPSHRLKLMIILIHALALAASMANDLDLTFKLGLITAICIKGWFTLKRLKNEHYTLKYSESLGWQISKDPNLVSIEILNSTVITTSAIFLHYKERSEPRFQLSPAKQTRLILNDALANEDYKHLLVKLKITHIK